MVVLDTSTGALFAYSYGPHAVGPDKNHGGPWYHELTDRWNRTWQWDRTPRQIAWSHRLWPMTTDEVAELLEWIVPRAQALVDALDPIPGVAGAYDWTRGACAQHRAIGTAVSNPHHRYMHEGPDVVPWATDGLLSFEEVIELWPDLVDPRWAVMGDAELDEVAARMVRSGWLSMTRADEARDRFGWGDARFGQDLSADLPRAHIPTYVIGARGGLRRYRGAVGVTADVDDVRLARIAEEGGARLDVLRSYRCGQRAAVRDELREVGERFEELEAVYLTLRRRRSVLTARVIAWRDPADYDGNVLRAAELGRLARMSRQAVLQIRDRVVSGSVRRWW